MEKKTYTGGEIICREGQPGKEMYEILSGKVRVFKTINEEKIELNTLGQGDFLGEMSLLLGDSRSASAEAIDNTQLLVLGKDSLLKKIQQDPQFALNMINIMARRLARANEIIGRLEGARKSLEIMYGVK
ncbi:MAG: Crp/Fnr family transcriptional regulator [Spirochaetota bacterium]